MPRLFPFREKVEILSAGAGTNNLDHDPERPGKIYHYTEIIVENKTTAFTRLLIGVQSEDKLHNYEEQQSPAAATLYPWHPAQPVVVYENEFLRCTLTGVTAADVLELHVAGYYEILEKARPAAKEKAAAADIEELET